MVSRTPKPTADGDKVVNDPPVSDEPFRANPFNEPMSANPKTYDDGYDAAAPKPVATETEVEHPLSPTDSNPNPHGNRDEPNFTPVVTKADGRSSPDEGEATITAQVDNLHLGDGRVLKKGESASVTKEIAKDLTTGDNKGKATRG